MSSDSPKTYHDALAAYERAKRDFDEAREELAAAPLPLDALEERVRTLDLEEERLPWASVLVLMDAARKAALEKAADWCAKARASIDRNAEPWEEGLAQVEAQALKTVERHLRLAANPCGAEVTEDG